MFTFTRGLRKERLAAESQRHVGYSFARLFKKWRVENCTLGLIGVGLDSLNGKGPMVSSLLGGFSFARLFLQLLEHRDRQVWTLPNAVTGLRVAGVTVAGAVALRSAKPDGGVAGGLQPWLLADGTLALLAVSFVALDLLDGFLARTLGQATALGAHLDTSADALGTAFLALSLHARKAMPVPLALHLAASAYLYPLLTSGAPAKRASAARHPWARPCAALVALLAVLAVAIPALLGSGVDAASGSASGGVSGRGHNDAVEVFGGFGFGAALAALRRNLSPEAGRWCGVGAGLASLCSSVLSYATVLAGVPLPGNGLGSALGSDPGRTARGTAGGQVGEQSVEGAMGANKAD